MARGDAITEFFTISNNSTYNAVSIPSDEEWLVTMFSGGNDNLISIYLHDNGSTNYSWMGDMTSTWLHNKVLKLTVNQAHTFSYLAHSGQPKYFHMSGFKTKDTS